ncbi:proprotein convertase subtilisin/kexin type 9 isoform X2 [Brachyhypopomus gauderio]|uniref:proprotein convertase subtilisin/kexin type 9 isoform X2 n=1 Tax=Brachyhypopomus gauderio TaxID=698409 RepID=UPI004041CA13
MCKMRRLVGLYGFNCLLCLVALVGCEDDYTEDDEMILHLIRQNDSRPVCESGPSAEFLRCTKGAWRVPGQYIVVVRNGTHENQVQRTARGLRAKAAKRGYLIDILRTYSGAFHGFLVKMSSDVLHMAVKLPHVEYIEEDSSIFAQGTPWNLERIIQTKHEPGKYTPPNDGSQVGVYLMDTSVQSTHRELEGRVMVTDFNSVPEEDGVRVHRQASQCDGHGTHVAGVVSGRDSGVAPGGSVNSVRVLNCQGKGTVSGALAGLEYIRAALRVQPISPVIVLLPFTGGFSRTLNAACREMVRSGAVLIAAAGNYQDDACLYSPASEPEVITVGASNAADQLLSVGPTGTNVGRCVDLFAPGDDIVSASSDCPTCFTAKSGTSQAAAHVAGIAAVLLKENPTATSAEVLQLLHHHAAQQVMNPEALPPEHRLTTPNMVAALPKPSSTRAGEALLCRSVWSERSGVMSYDMAVARCRHGEEMFSCSSYSPDGVWAGEKVEVRDDQKECVAHNGARGRGVYAVARCCTGARGQCWPSGSPNVGTEARCPSPQHQLTGCSSYFGSGGVADSTRPLHGNSKACPARSGATSHASCCHAPGLECRVDEHQPSGFMEQVEVSCGDSWTLTGCRGVSPSSAPQSAYARGNTCLVRPTRGETGVGVVAICCRHPPPPQHASQPVQNHSARPVYSPPVLPAGPGRSGRSGSPLEGELHVE